MPKVKTERMCGLGGVEPTTRERPAATRCGVTHQVTLYQSAEPHGTGLVPGDAGSQAVEFFITVNRFADGRPCEVFAKATGGYQGWCDAICRLVSLLLQHGVAMETIERQLAHAHFTPCGMVPGFGFARSFPDYLARWVVGKERAGGSGQAEGGVEQKDAKEVKSDGTRMKGGGDDADGGVDAGGVGGAG